MGLIVMKLAIFFSVVSSIVSIIASLSKVRRWLPVKLTEKEKAILKLTVSEDKYNDILYLWSERKDNIKSVSIPYGRHIEVGHELTSLESKGLVKDEGIDSEIHGVSGKKRKYRLTQKGIKIANNLNKTS